mmetsp:Transcript_20759/g.36953  ORF Transcript_20759/g.36953 Transcript_20759/m.36953 type:complete len:225 (-) Transcript_20759:969-1643(-)
MMMSFVTVPPLLLFPKASELKVLLNISPEKSIFEVYPSLWTCGHLLICETCLAKFAHEQFFVEVDADANEFRTSISEFCIPSSLGLNLLNTRFFILIPILLSNRMKKRNVIWDDFKLFARTVHIHRPIFGVCQPNLTFTSNHTAERAIFLGFPACFSGFGYGFLLFVLSLLDSYDLVEFAKAVDDFFKPPGVERSSAAENERRDSVFFGFGCVFGLEEFLNPSC